MKNLEFISQYLGDDFFESLTKSEVMKPVTNTVVDHEELASALKIVPRVVMSWLMKNLAPLEVNEIVDLEIPFPQTKNSRLKVQKLSKDVYTGEITEENKVANRFYYRTIPGIGLIMLTTFELYSMEEMDKNKEDKTPDISSYVQAAIEERLKLKDLVDRVVDKKISEREAVESLILSKINTISKETQVPTPPQVPAHTPILIVKVADSGDKKGVEKLDEFLKKRKKKKKYFIPMLKSEAFCRECGGVLFKNEKVTPCVCYGNDMNHKVYLRKKENETYLEFSRKWEEDNITMILEALRNSETGE